MGNVIGQPAVNLSLVSADLEVANAAQKVLLIGQFLGSGAVTGVLEENIKNDGEENSKFQIDSQLADMVRAFKRIAPSVQLDCIPLADAGGTAATYTITLTGGATESGTLTIVAGSEKNHKVSAAVISGEAITVTALAIVASVNADLTNPFTASAVVGVVTLTHNHAGTIGEGQPIQCTADGEFSGSIAGLTIVVAQGATGATDPTEAATSAIFDTIGNRRYQGIVWPYLATRSVPADWLDDRFNTNNRILDGVAFHGSMNTFSTHETAALALNSKSLILFDDEEVAPADSVPPDSYMGPANPEAGYIVATSFAALRALRLTDGAALSRYHTTRASRDQFGGTAQASLPYFNDTIPQLPVTKVGLGFTDAEIESLFTAGASVIGQNASGTNSLIGEVVTTYKTDPASNDDPSWKFLNYIDTMSAVREYFFNNYKKRFGQSRLTTGNVLRGRDMVNKELFEAYTDRLFGDLTGSDFVLLEAGEDALNFFKANRTVVLNLVTGTVTVTMLTPIVTQTRVIVGTIQIVFSSTQEG